MYGWDTMDGHVEGAASARPAYVMHYTRYRTFNRSDRGYRRQLGFRNPPEDTVVTWNDSFITKDANGAPKDGNYLVLFLNGEVKRVSVRAARDVAFALWRLKP